MSASALHHYVPQFLLKRFGIGESNRVHVYDKSKSCAFTTSVKNVAAERGLYDFEFMGSEMTLEPALSRVEGLAARAIDAIERRRWLPHAASEERLHLAGFLAIQLVRTRAQMNMKADMLQRMERWLRTQGMDESFFAPEPEIGVGENADKARLSRDIAVAHREYAPILLEKDWLLLQTTKKHPFIIGDSPLAMHNAVDRGPRGNLGIRVKGIELYLPINPELALALLCPTQTAELRQGVERYQRLAAKPEVHQRFGESAASARRMLEALEGGSPVPSRPENVEFHNSLQVIEAERFVFSMSDNFALAKDMVQSDPRLRFGPRNDRGIRQVLSDEVS